MEPVNISCSALVDALTALAQNCSQGRRSSAVKTIPRSQDTSYLTDTADAVREVGKKLGKTRVKWENPKSVMIITKPGDCSLIKMTREMALYLIETPRYGSDSGITCYVDEKLKCSKRFNYEKIINKHPVAKTKLKFWTPELCAAKPKSFDFIITLGGDGTVLFSSWLFQNYIPPVIPFHLGSLGFLTPFDFDRYRQHLHNAMESGVRINLRGRLTCTVYRRVPHPDCKSPEEAKTIQLRNVVRDPVTGKFTVGNWCQEMKNQQCQRTQEAMKISNKQKKFGEVDGDDIEEEDAAVWSETCQEIAATAMPPAPVGERRQVPCFTTVPVEKYHVINDLVVDRGPSPYVSLLELFGDDKHLTTVQADGLAISTPTGSTAYSLSAGGSLTHPDIHAILITPICPHTLSFRPTLVPDSMELRICVPYNSRNTAWASFDGRGRVELKQGDHIKVTASRYPFPTVCKEDQATDWFNSLQNCLHWNKRERQKSFAVVESNATRHPRRETLLTKIQNHPQALSHLPQLPKASTPNYTPSIRPLEYPSPPPAHPLATPPVSSMPQQQQQQQQWSPKQGQNDNRKSSSSSSITSSSSDAGQDEVFGMFYDDDSGSDRYHMRGSGQRMSDRHRHDSCAEVGSSASSLGYDSVDELETDEDDEEIEGYITNNDGFVGWTDEEIMKSRYLASITKELERVSLTSPFKETISEGEEIHFE
ncbi:ATP-NAD kinase-like domain-containing protein [Mycotypha africana]|uniref:ATP-NAD kinase-like domain-containing protein n=1 Tax=Mycotypha africana TaxID=64632 RepID=UPI0023014AC2|nr:ATP-NAD kinase-like domain-containing protein [Mycotypha africana]KAI8991566.1 ATP-NAD kinase-like domain-containing protein [Mycotypha africana]